jgi:hypothetical protein
MQGREERRRPLSGPQGTNREIAEHKEMEIKGRSKRGRGLRSTENGKGRNTMHDKEKKDTEDKIERDMD